MFFFWWNKIFGWYTLYLRTIIGNQCNYYVVPAPCCLLFLPAMNLFFLFSFRKLSLMKKKEMWIIHKREVFWELQIFWQLLKLLEIVKISIFSWQWETPVDFCLFIKTKILGSISKTQFVLRLSLSIENTWYILSYNGFTWWSHLFRK